MDEKEDFDPEILDLGCTFSEQHRTSLTQQHRVSLSQTPPPETRLPVLTLALLPIFPVFPAFICFLQKRNRKIFLPAGQEKLEFENTRSFHFLQFLEQDPFREV